MLVSPYVPELTLQLPELVDVRTARERIAPFIRRTQTILSQAVSDRIGTNVHLKLEMFQKTGAFKVRGAFNRILAMTAEERTRGVVAASAGNHGQAVAYAARRLGMPAIVVMPESTPLHYLEATTEYGATLRLTPTIADALNSVRRYIDDGDEVKSVWMDGELMPWAKANVHVSSHALHYGSGVFEGIRCYATDNGPAVFRLEEHIDRLFASAALHGLNIPYTRTELSAAVCQTISANGFASCYVRPIVFFGSATLALNPRTCPVEVVVLAFPWPAMLGDEAAERGVRITISQWRKFSSQMMPTTAKACGQYVNSVLAVRDAAGRGYDEALLLDHDGEIAEGAGENLFVVRDDVVRTNDSRQSILMGITRDSVLTIARDLGLTVKTAAIRVEDLMFADEAFFTGTAAEVTPIREIDGARIGHGRPGEVTRRIQRTYLEATAGNAQRYRRWLHFVDDCTFAGAYSALPCI